MTILLLMAVATGAEAQNSIDVLVDKYSTLGSSTFTSVVERNPTTRKMQKMVKMLKLEGMASSETFCKAFRKESSSGSLVENIDKEYTTMLLTVEQPKATRIYMIKYRRNGYGVEVTIVVKCK